jgi:hypothetical protein
MMYKEEVFMCHARFGLYDVAQWELLTEQVTDKYGIAVLDREFNMKFGQMIQEVWWSRDARRYSGYTADFFTQYRRTIAQRIGPDYKFSEKLLVFREAPL